MADLAKLVKQMVDDSGLDISYRADYSGRGMYGEKCVGIVGSHRDCMGVIGEVINGLHCEDDSGFVEQVKTLLSFRSDSMGRSDIILFWEDIVEEDEEEEPQLASEQDIFDDLNSGF